MPTMTDFEAPFATASLDLRPGLTLSLRALSQAEEHALTEAWPAPRVPLRKDPTKGSAAPPVPDEDDPQHLAARARWDRELDVLHAAVSMGYEAKAGPFRADAGREERRAWCRAVVDELSPRLTAPEARRIYSEIARLNAVHLVARAGEGNSSSGVETA